jgi:hypothetical protein
MTRILPSAAAQIQDDASCRHQPQALGQQRRLSVSQFPPARQKDSCITIIGLKGLRDDVTCGMVRCPTTSHVPGGTWMISRRGILAALLGLAFTAGADANAADPPCDTYPPAKQQRCTVVWKELNKEDGPLIAQFGLDQQRRRDEGKITAQQHLAENMTFIRQSTEKRLERLKARMAKE